jgi:hypothetical protein
MTHLRLNGSELGYYDDENQPIDYVGDEPVASSFQDGQKLVQALFDQTDFLSRYKNTDENIDVLIRVSRRLNRHNQRPDALTLKRFIEAFHTADQAGGECGDCGTLEKLPAPTPQASRLRDEDGRFLNPHVAAYLEMLNTPSVPALEIMRKMRNPEFAAAVEAWRNPKPVARDVDPDELKEARRFVSAFRQAPSIRFVEGYTKLGEYELTRAELDSKIARATELGLL